MKSIDEAHRADYADKRRMDDLRREIEAFLADPPRRLPLGIHRGLEGVAVGLRVQSAFITRVWS